MLPTGRSVVHLHIVYAKTPFSFVNVYVVIKVHNKTFASLQRKKKVVIVFWMLFHGNMTAAAHRHADFPQYRQLN